MRKAESEKVTLLRRQRNFGVVVVALGVIVLIAGAALGYLINENRKSLKQRAAGLEKQAQRFRENAKAVLANGKDDPTKDVTALRNFAIALNLSRDDTESAKRARNLLLGRVWCPPAAPEVRYRQDTLLAATFAPGGKNNEVFAAAGDGQLLFWGGRELSSKGS